MKKIITTFLSFLLLSAIYVYPQKMKPMVNEDGINSKPSISKIANSILVPTITPKKVIVHHMGWFGAGSNGRHWQDSVPRIPLIGYYNSQSWATQIYHILLSWSCGIDGLVVNIIDDYDKQSLKLMVQSIQRIKDIDSTTFKYEIGISNDDQAMDKIGIDTAVALFTFYRDNIINTPSYLKYNNIPSIFIYPYNFGADKYKLVLDSVFHAIKPKILWKEIDPAAKDFANSYYSWVQGFSTNGLNWGKTYLDWFYPTLANSSLSQYPNLEFATGGVWAGFDDRDCSWGLNRWIDRQNGAVYDSTWNYIHTYDSLHPNSLIPLNWVYVTTWNDFNEGTEIEPSTEFRYKYLLSTIKNINAFKGDTISQDTCKFEAAMKIYAAADSIELSKRDSGTYYSCLESAIKYFIQNNCDLALCYANHILNPEQGCPCTNSINEYDNFNFEIYPNPANDKLYIKLKDNGSYKVQIINNQGIVLLDQRLNNQLETIDISSFPKGMYLIKIFHDQNIYVEKIIIR